MSKKGKTLLALMLLTTALTAALLEKLQNTR